MTLNHAASALSGLLAVAGGVLLVATGSLTWGLLVLAASAPVRWVQASERRTWSLGEVVRGRRDDQTVSDALDRALRVPLPTPRSEDDGTLFLPDCPRLDDRRSRPDAGRPAVLRSTPASTPIR